LHLDDHGRARVKINTKTKIKPGGAQVAVVVTAKSGYDISYPWKGQAAGQDGQRAGERTSGGYYINAAQAGEAPGRWFGKGAEVLGLAAGQQVEREPYDAVYQQVSPQDGTKLGSAPGGYATKADHLARLMAAEPHATAERVAELERQAAQAERRSPAYTDVTVSLSKSVSILHASIRENERRASLDGDQAGMAYWQAREAEYQQIVQAANRAGLEHLQRWAATRTGRHGVRVDGQEPGRYERADIIVTSWLQGTSREGDPQDHVHNVIARVARTPRDGKWRALDTMSVRAQLGAVQGIVSAHAEAGLTRAFGVAWVARADGRGNEIQGITREQMDLFSTRTVQVQEKGRELAAAWEEAHGRPPNRRELLFIMNEATLRSRQGKEAAEIDWRDKAEEWDATIGGDLAQIAPRVSNLGAAHGPREPGARDGEAQARGLAAARAAVPADAQARTMTAALARVQEKHSTWTRADLMREMSALLPDQAHQLAPAAAVELLHDLTDRALAGETEPVACLEAPEWPPVPDSLRRDDLDGRSEYTRPGTERYATHVQLSREEQLTTTAQRTGAPCLTREQSAQALGATAEQLEAAGRERAQDATTQLPSGLREGQAAALHHAITSPRTVSLIIGPAGSGKTRVLAEAAKMWPGDVVGVAPSQAARNVLAAATGAQAYNTAQFLGHTEQQRGALGPMGIHPGTLILLDEASMTSLQDIADIVEHAAAHGSKVLVTGDHGQLTAVEGGGGMALLARQMEHAQLAEPVRFREGWEREASLRLRAGDVEVLPEYDQHGRIRGGTAEDVLDRARRGYVAAYLDGRDALLMARSHDTCHQLAQQIRDDLQHLGHVDATGPETVLREGARASAGDLIITRENDHELGVANGDTWRVERVCEDGSVTMRQAVNCDPVTGARRFAEETITYRDAARSADLAYVVTGHSAQGRTVEEACAVVTGTEDREWAYVALSRARAANRAEVITEPRAADPKPGTRPAPELAQADRAASERAGQDVTVTGHGDSHAALGILSDVLDRPGAEMSALETLHRNLANADHLGKLGTIWEAETAEAIRSRYERSLREQLPANWRGVPLSERSTWLWRSLRQAEAAGLDADEVLAQAINARSLDGTRDLAAVLDDRIREQTSGLVPQPVGPWAERVPDLGDPDRTEYVRQLAAAMDERKERLGEHTAEAAPAWARRALGPVPEEPLERLAWERRAADIAAYREQYGYDHTTEPIGPEPTSDSPEKRAAWYAAFQAMGPVDGVDVRGEPDGRLLLMRRQYQSETAWAPQWVGDELRQVRLGAQDAAELAVRSEAEAKAARQRGDEETAGRHEVLAASARAMGTSYRGYETKFAAAMQVRGEWEQATEHTRHLAIAADSEYRRRHPEEQLEPLRSAEPAAPAEEEREQLATAAAAGDSAGITPAWVADLAGRVEQAREQLAERAAERIPAEDHEWEDEGLAWPRRVAAERDAILQPPKPAIRPAQRVAELAAERDREYEAGL
jgi:conjugative relaxase-like TrwC/TraI family protein